ncbi:VPA1262 family N-terminal domain-containing protein [Dyella jiangningensis]|nr:VPA1262 family N-terminal domain-containing protein [Dyella jiangningensis]MDG2539223.1 VPA1262 family N-terminal domain-containing protein [Dyella jiangningensis]
MPPPPNGEWWQNFGSDRYCIGRTVLPLTEAIAWYETLGRGCATVPGLSASITAVRLAPEPDYNGFSVLPEPPPFSPDWHGKPRLHRLVPMDALSEPVEAIRNGSTEVQSLIRAREWLRQHIHFDLLAYDDWLGSGALIAPNPLLRYCGTRIIDRSASGETIEAGGTPRRAADLSTLRLTVQEVRGGALGWRAEGIPDTFGRFSATSPTQVATIRHGLFCSLRGLLDHEAPAGFIRGISVSPAAPTVPREAAPPRREPSAPIRTTFVRPQPTHPSAPPPTALYRLEKLRRAQADRTGDLRPAEAPQIPRHVRLLESDREETVTCIRNLIASARSQILFVDPYLDADDLQEFATAASYEGVAVRGLINPRPSHNRRADASGDLFGEQMLEKIQALRDPAERFGDIDIRVSRLRRLHDRFLQIDDVIWHCGHSFNQVGRGEISLMTLVAEPAETREVLEKAFAEAEPFETYWINRPIPPWSLRKAIGDQIRRLARWIERPRDARQREANDD